MFGLIRKSKVLNIIEKGQDQLIDKQLEIENMKGTTKEQNLDIRDSINRLKGGIDALKFLKRHFY